MKKIIQLAAPWNVHTYMCNNGFHPLYQALFESNDLNIKINVVDELKLFQLLLDEKYSDKLIKDMDALMAGIKFKLKGKTKEIKLLDYWPESDLWISNNIPGDIEFHHTSIVSLRQRPFILHCESFIPIFMPFAYQGAGVIKDADSVKKIYKEIFSDEKCLGIFSHLQITLEQIKDFFNDEKINQKLFLTRVGLPDIKLKSLIENNRKFLRDKPIFLFTSSSHQQSEAFKLRGGVVALLFAEKLISTGYQAQFIFRCRRPSNDELKLFKLNIDFLKKAEELQQIIWIEGYQQEKDQMNLFKSADFFLMPSANLHSVSIMQAQVAGVIPVVTDTVGVDRFVSDEQTGIVLNGVKEALWKVEKNSMVYIDDHRRYTIELAIDLADQLYNRIVILINKPETYVNLKKKMQHYALHEYDGERFRVDFFSKLKGSINTINCKEQIHYNNFIKLPLINFSTDDQHKLFESPPVPKLVLSVESVKIYFLKGYYWIVPIFFNGSSWNLLALAKLRVLGKDKTEVVDCLGATAERLLPITDFVSKNEVIELAHNVHSFSMNSPFAKKILKLIYPYLRSLISEIENIISAEDESLRIGKSKFYVVLSKIPIMAVFARRIKKLIIYLITKDERIFKAAKFIRLLFIVIIKVLISIVKSYRKKIKAKILVYKAKLYYNK